MHNNMNTVIKVIARISYQPASAVSCQHLSLVSC